MDSQKGVVALAVPLLLLIIAAAIYIVISQGILKTSLQSIPNIPGISKKEPTVSLQTQFENPFDKETQFKNPFSKYKNPFDGL